MSVIRVFTNDGREVDAFDVNDLDQPGTVGRAVTGRSEPILGWLGRTLHDAKLIQRGEDPERPSEKAMRPEHR